MPRKAATVKRRRVEIPEEAVTRRTAAPAMGYVIAPGHIKDAAKMLTIDETMWLAAPRSAAQSALDAWMVRGSFVRLKPPVGTEDADIEIVRSTLIKLGAAAVRVIPPVKELPLPNEVHDEVAPKATARVAVLALAEEANTQDRRALKELCEKTLGEVGL